MYPFMYQAYGPSDPLWASKMLQMTIAVLVLLAIGFGLGTLIRWFMIKSTEFGGWLGQRDREKRLEKEKYRELEKLAREYPSEYPARDRQDDYHI